MVDDSTLWGLILDRIYGVILIGYIFYGLYKLAGFLGR